MIIIKTSILKTTKISFTGAKGFNIRDIYQVFHVFYSNYSSGIKKKSFKYNFIIHQFSKTFFLNKRLSSIIMMP